MKHSLLLFDGICNLCNTTVQTIIKYDTKEIFKFAALQSPVGQQILQQFQLPKKNFETLVLVENTHCYFRSTAALRVAWRLGGFWRLLYLFIIIPRPLRDYIYSFVAKNRYKWYGKQASCMMPTPELRRRFLE